MSSAILRQMESPRPVPPYSRVVEPSAWRKAAKIASSLSATMPMPVSRTVTCRSRPAAFTPSAKRASSTSPARVNLTALSIRLTSTWRKRPGSPLSCGGSCGSMRQRMSMGRWARRGRMRVHTSRAMVSGAKGTCSRSSRPASILEKSRMSLSRVSRASALVRMVRAKDCCSLSRPVSRSRSVKPRTAFIGVRISWLMAARKALLAVLAASAAPLAVRNSSVCLRISSCRVAE